MGVSGLWNDFDNATETTTLPRFADSFWTKHNRQPRIAVDISVFLYELSESTKSWGHINFHRQFVRRLAALQAAGIHVIGVFDGPEMHPKLRHKQHKKRAVGTKVLLFMRECLTAMGIPVINAPSEAEAQCCELQRLGLADAVFSSDSDVFCLGAKTVMRYAPEQAGFAEMSALMRPIQVVELAGDEEERWSYILRAILLGNDFDAGVVNLGARFAKQIAESETNFPSELRKCYRSQSGRTEWLCRLENELKTNESGYFRQLKNNAIFPSNFPDPEIIELFACPKVSDFGEGHVLQAEYNIHRLQQLWLGPSPLKCRVPIVQTGPKRQIRKVSTEQEFVNTIAGAVLVIAIMTKGDQKQWYQRVTLPSEANYTVNVVLSEYCHWLPGATSRSTRIAHFVAKKSPHDILNKHSLAHRDNSRVDSFFQPASSIPAPAPSPARLPAAVVADQSAYIDPVDDGGDTDQDELETVLPTPRPLKRSRGRSFTPDHMRSCSLLASCMPPQPSPIRRSLTLPATPITGRLQPLPSEEMSGLAFRRRELRVLPRPNSEQAPKRAVKSQSARPRCSSVLHEARKTRSVSAAVPPVSRKPLQPTILELFNRATP